jgi:hypothetical protein
VPIMRQKNTNIFQLFHCQQTQSVDHAVELHANNALYLFCPFCFSPPLLSFSILSPPFHFSFIHLPAVFAPYFSPFPSLPLSHFAACVRSSHCRRRRVTSCTLSLLRPIPVLSLLVPTSESRHHFSLSHTLSPLPIVLRFSYSLLLIRVFVPLPFYSPSPCTFSRRVVFFFSPSSRNFSSVSHSI